MSEQPRGPKVPLRPEHASAWEKLDRLYEDLYGRIEASRAELRAVNEESAAPVYVTDDPSTVIHAAHLERAAKTAARRTDEDESTPVNGLPIALLPRPR